MGGGTRSRGLDDLSREEKSGTDRDVGVESRGGGGGVVDRVQGLVKGGGGLRQRTRRSGFACCA